MIVLITGGARSGKSSHAQQLALQNSSSPVYVATAKVWDTEFEKRVQRHKNERGPQWTSYEQQKDLHTLPIAGRTVVIDCVTLWLTNYFTELKQDVKACLAAFKAEVDAIAAMEGTFIIVSNELGMGLHGEHAAGRHFTDLQGWANQYVAAKAQTAIFMVAGLPITLKGVDN